MCADTHPTTQKENMNQKNKGKEVLVISSPHVVQLYFPPFPLISTSLKTQLTMYFDCLARIEDFVTIYLN